MRICFLLTRRVPDVPSPIVLEVQRLLERMGHEVTGWIPEDRLLRTDVLRPEADLYVLKSHTELALSYAGALHGQGVAVCNEYSACLTAQDKVTAGRLMRELSVPPLTRGSSTALSRRLNCWRKGLSSSNPTEDTVGRGFIWSRKLRS